MAYVSSMSYGGDPIFLLLGKSRFTGGMTGMGDLGDVIAGVSGLGATPSPAGYPDFASFQAAVIASFPPCPPPNDPTCQNPRDAAIAAALNDWVTDPQSCHNVVCGAAGQPQVSYQPYTTPQGQPAAAVGVNTTQGFVPVVSVPPGPAPAPAPVARNPRPAPRTPPASPPTYSPQLSFATSAGGNSLTVGDTWTVSITGAPPNTPVSVTGNSSGSTNDSVTTSEGTTDGNGNFSLSGRAGSGDVGIWAEAWNVNGQTVGSFSFTVSAAPVQPSAPAPAPSPAPDNSSAPSPASYFQQKVTIGGWNIPVWGFIVAAGGAALLLLGEAKS